MLVLLAVAALATPAPCGTPERALPVGSLAPPTRPARPERPPPPDGLLVRDAYDVPNAHETEHFVVRWGNAGAVSRRDVERLGTALERVWDVEIDELGYPRPWTTTWYKLNVYIGDSGDGAPASGGNAGFYWYDDEAYPMLVVSTIALADPGLAEATAAHEFFHGVQAAAATYAFTEADFWYGEATATWITSQVFPDNTAYASLLFGQAFRPEQSIHAYLADGDAIDVFHAYGAFVFVVWLEEQAFGADGVRRSWVDAPAGGDPLDVIAGMLPDHGWTLQRALADFAARNATWDYDDRTVYVASIETSGGWDAPGSRRPVAALAPGDWTSPPAEAEGIHTLGAHYWTVPTDAPARVSFEGDPGPTWTVTLAGLRDGEPLRRPLTDAPVTVDDLDTWDEAWLVVAGASGRDPEPVIGDYRVRLEIVEEAPEDTDAPGDTDAPEDTDAPDDTDDVVDTDAPWTDPGGSVGEEALGEAGGCGGCVSTGAAGGWLAWVGLLVGWGRRRMR